MEIIFARDHMVVRSRAHAKQKANGYIIDINFQASCLEESWSLFIYW